MIGDGQHMHLILYYSVLVAAWIGAIGYLVKSFHAFQGGKIARPRAIRTLATGIFGVIFWLMIILISTYNQLTQ